MTKIYVCERGWILVGKEVSQTDGGCHVSGASVVRHWANGRGIGGLAKKDFKQEYILDHIGTVYILTNKILFEIPCDWEAEEK